MNEMIHMHVLPDECINDVDGCATYDCLDILRRDTHPCLLCLLLRQMQAKLVVVDKRAKEGK